MKKVFEIADIITALIQGEISREELEKLDEWLERAEDNKALFVSFMDEKIFADEKLPYSRQKMEMVFADIRRRKQQIKHKRNLRIWSSVAAVIAVFWAVSFWVQPMRKVSEPSAQETIAIGKKMAYLVLSDGERIELPVTLKDTISLAKSHKQIILDHGRLEIEGDEPDSSEAIDDYHVMEVPRGAEYSFVLPDGTKVWLNADSKLKFPEQFRGPRRFVELSGEAYFEVTHDEMRPFVVHSDNIDVKVLGTEFCIRSYRDRPTLATLVQGNVEVTDQSGCQTVLQPGQQAETFGGSTTVREVETIYYTAWKDGYFVFENTPLEEIMEELSLWYDCQYFFLNPVAAQIRITARLKKYDEIDVLLNILTKTNEVQIEKKGKAISIRKK